MPKLGRFDVCERKASQEGVVFDLQQNQTRDDEFVHNGWWFVLDSDGRAHQLGTGDLSQADLKRIGSNLQPGERWLIMKEDAPYELGSVGLFARCCANTAVLTRDQVLAAAYLVVSRDRLLVVDPHVLLEGFTRITREELAAEI
jgi:hypothetical protein